MKALDQGIQMVLDTDNDVSELHFVCAPPLAITGDTPQQQLNSGYIGVSGTYGCRLCQVSKNQRSNLDFDIIGTSRAHRELVRQQRRAAAMPPGAARERYCTANGLAQDPVGPPALSEITPALDLVTTQPADAAHSELQGMAKMVYSLLAEAILTSAGLTKYCRVLIQVPFPVGWGRLQSPMHIKSYTLQEHARWLVIGSLALRLTLRDGDIKSRLVPSLVRSFKNVVDRENIRVASSNLAENDSYFGSRSPSVPHLIMTTMAALTQCSVVLMAPGRIGEGRFPESLMTLIKRSHLYFQLLCNAASRTSSSARWTATPAAQRALSEVSGVIPSVEEAGGNEQEATTLRAIKYEQWSARPNVHFGLHYPAVLEEYGFPSLMSVLAGEAKHRLVLRLTRSAMLRLTTIRDRLYKAKIYKTNHKDPEANLFAAENFMLTCRLIISGAFGNDEPELTGMFTFLIDRCPSLMGLFPRADNVDAVVAAALDEQESDSDRAESNLGTIDEQHRNPRVMHRIAPKACSQLGLPNRLREVSQSWKSKVQESLRRDYHKNIILTGSGVIRWWKNTGFVDVQVPLDSNVAQWTEVWRISVEVL